LTSFVNQNKAGDGIWAAVSNDAASCSQWPWQANKNYNLAKRLVYIITIAVKLQDSFEVWSVKRTKLSKTNY